MGRPGPLARTASERNQLELELLAAEGVHLHDDHGRCGLVEDVQQHAAATLASLLDRQFVIVAHQAVVGVVTQRWQVQDLDAGGQPGAVGGTGHH